MAWTIQNPNKFSPAFMADLKSKNPQLYFAYTTGTVKIDPKVSINYAKDPMQNKDTSYWTVVVTPVAGANTEVMASNGNIESNKAVTYPTIVSFNNTKFSQNQTSGFVNDQFGNRMPASTTDNGKNFQVINNNSLLAGPGGVNASSMVDGPRNQCIPWNNAANPQNLDSYIRLVQYGIVTKKLPASALTDLLNGKTDGINGTIYGSPDPGTYQRKVIISQPPITSIDPNGKDPNFYLARWTDINGNFMPVAGSGTEFSVPLKPTGNQFADMHASSMYYDKPGGARTAYAPNVEPPPNYQSFFADPKNNASWGGFKQALTDMPATPITDPVPTGAPTTTIPKAPPTTVPTKPTTTTTVPKAPPTTVPTKPTTTTTVPKAPPTTVPPHPTTTVPPHPTTTVPPHATTTVPPHATTTVPPHATTTVPRSPVPTPTTTTTTPTTTPVLSPLVPSWGTTTSSNTFKYPDAKYFTDRGITDPKILALAGQSVYMLHPSSDPKKIIQAMVDQLGNENSKKLFAELVAEGFDPTGFQRTKTKSTFNNWVSTFGTSLMNQGWTNFDPTKYRGTNTGAIVVPSTVSTGNTNVLAGSGAGQTAYGIVAQNLTNWGMEDLIPKVYDLVFKKGVTDGRQLLTAIRAEPEYKQTFVGLDKYNATNSKPMTEAQYLANAQSYRDIADKYGLPSGFFTRQEIGQLVAGGVAPTEFNRRLANGYQVAATADDATKKYLAQQGVDMGHLLAYYLDPTKAEPMLTQKATQAQLQGYAQNVGVRDFNTAMAQELARRAKSNINTDGTFSVAEEQKALEGAGVGAGLTGNAPGANAPTVSTTQLIGSQLQGFGGTTMPEAQQAVTLAEQGKAAPFQKGGGYEAGNKGVTGVGSAPQ